LPLSTAALKTSMSLEKRLTDSQKTAPVSPLNTLNSDRIVSP